MISFCFSFQNLNGLSTESSDIVPCCRNSAIMFFERRFIGFLTIGAGT